MLLPNVWRDLVHAVKSLAKSRAFTSVCVLSLGIGMAPVIGIQYGARAFTTPPPGVNTEGLVELVTRRVGPRGPSDKWSYPDFVDLRDAAAGVAIAGWATGDASVTLPESGKTGVTALFVSSTYFRVVGVALARGPGLPPMNASADPAVVLSHGFWQQRLASDPAIVGRMLTVDGVQHAVAGIAAEEFGGHLPFQDAEVFLPLERHPTLLADSARRFDRGRAWIHLHGRLSPGVTMTQASEAVSAFTAQLAREYPATHESVAGIAAPYHPIGNVEGEDARIVLVLWNVLTAVPLIVVCLNLSGMVQVRSAMRERELSIRQAIGASPRRLIQHLLAESVVLAVVGGALATLVLFNSLSFMAWWLDEPLPRQMERALTIDVPMLAILAGLCLATSLVFGWLPAVRFSRPRIMTVLKDDAGGGRVRAGRVHRVTSALQVALAVPLLVFSTMSLERVRATASADLGFASEVLYAAPVESGVDDELRRMRDTLARQAGVASVTVADGLPLDFRYRVTSIATESGADAAPITAQAHVTRVGDGYLDTMGVPLAAGRGFTTDDRAGAPMVTVISRALAQALFPEGDAIGQRLTYSVRTGEETRKHVLAVVGVTADFPTSQISTDREQLLLPFAQHPDVRRDSVAVNDDREGRPVLMLIARAAPGEPPAKLQAALENTIREVDPAFDGDGIVTGVWLRQNSVDDFINASAFAGISGGVALLLAALGIYGVVGLMVTTRTREIAVRVTLGASGARVIGMILFDVVKLVGPGVVAGALITALLARAEGGVAVSNIEPLAYVAGAAIALLTALLASLAPARRAASVEPMVAMRST